MQKQIVIHARQKKFEDTFTYRNLEIERAIDKPKVARAPHIKFFDFTHERIQLKRPRRFVQCRQAKLAFERAAARRFNINKALGDVLIRVLRIRQSELRQWRLLTRDNLALRYVSRHDFKRKLGKRYVAPAGNHIIGQRTNALIARLVADLRATQHHSHVGRDFFEQRHHARTFIHVPDIHADTNDARIQRQQILNDLERTLPQHKLDNACARLQFAHVCRKITQAQRGVHIAGVDGGEYNVCHRPSLAACQT